MTKYAKDLFISYAHIDNQPLTPKQEGWVSRFHTNLKNFLESRKGGAADIWRDTRLRGNDVFSDEIIDRIADTAVLVSILTPRYLNSEWCTREVCEFCKQAEKKGGVVHGNKARVFKVLKIPVESEDTLPPVVKSLLGYEFYVEEEGRPFELDPVYGEEYTGDYLRKIGMLAYDISEMLKDLEAETGRAAEPVGDTAKASIYLAECSYDRKQAREMLECELRHHGYTILPNQQLPRSEADYVEAVAELLEQCSLSIHLVGETYGAVPFGPSQKSVVVLQNEIAAKQAETGALRRVIWLPEGTSSDHQQQKTFIEALHRDGKAQYGADLITSDFEDLKTAIHAALKKPDEPDAEQPSDMEAPDSRHKQIYLICHEKDRKDTVAVRKYLRQQGFDIAIPAFEGSAKAVREVHQRYMVNCDGVILFYGHGDEAWKRTMTSDLRKMPGYRSGKPLLANYTLLSTPRTDDKVDLIDMEEPNLINCLESFSEDAMAPFLQAMTSGGA